MSAFLCDSSKVLKQELTRKVLHSSQLLESTITLTNKAKKTAEVG
jgi:hypothetical protein